MSAGRRSQGDKNYIYYRCPAPFIEKESCTHRKRMREDILEQYLLNNLSDLMDAYNITVKKKSKRRNKEDKSRIKARMDKLKDLYLSDLIDKDTYAEDYNALRDVLTTIEQEENVVPLNKSYIMTALEMYASLSRQSRKAFWTRILDRIEVDQNGNISVFFSRIF